MMRSLKNGHSRRTGRLVSAVAGLILAGLVGAPGSAHALSFELNCVVTASGCAPAASFGMITLTDNADNVNLTVDLEGAGVHKVLKVFLNYADSLFSNADAFNTTSTAGVLVGENARQADGYTAGFFDLQIPDPPPGNLGFELYTDTIVLPGFDLNPGHFNFLDTAASLFAAVHIGSYGGAPGVGGADSIWVGAVVPEPGTLVLLGSGLAGLGAWGWRRRRARARGAGLGRAGEAR